MSKNFEIISDASLDSVNGGVGRPGPFQSPFIVGHEPQTDDNAAIKGGERFLRFRQRSGPNGGIVGGNRVPRFCLTCGQR
jgi:hypothetical protein